MMRFFAISLLLLCVSFGAEAQGSRRVEVRVVDVSGKWAYLSAGTAKGLRPGARVMFGKTERRVERATHSYAVVSAKNLKIGLRGTAVAAAASKDDSDKLPTPRELDAFTGMWPAVRKPAEDQHPKSVPLGRMKDGKGRADATLSTSGMGFIPLEGDEKALYRADLRARMNATLVESWPLRLMADAAVMGWFNRKPQGVAAGDDRPLVRVRELGLSVGEAGGYRAQVGRLRYAAPSLGPLDGARVEAAQWGPVHIAAFGGLLPDPIDNQFATGAGRFGVEVDVVGEDMRTHPEVTLVAQGSTFDGKLDERRLYAHAQLWPGEHRLAAYAQVSFFDEDNVWGRPRADLTWAGADADFRFGDVHLGARFDLRRPERSLWLAKSFPTTWLCSSTSVVDAAWLCQGNDDTRYTAQAFGGWDLTFMQVDLGGGYTASSEEDLGKSGYGYGTLRFPHVGERYDLAIGASHDAGSLLLSNTALRADFGMGFMDERVHLTLYYRPTYRRYRASLEGLWEQGAGASMLINPTPRFQLNVFGDLRLGDVDAALLMMQAMVRLGG